MTNPQSQLCVLRVQGTLHRPCVKTRKTSRRSRDHSIPLQFGIQIAQKFRFAHRNKLCFYFVHILQVKICPAMATQMARYRRKLQIQSQKEEKLQPSIMYNAHRHVRCLTQWKYCCMSTTSNKGTQKYISRCHNTPGIVIKVYNKLLQSFTVPTKQEITWADQRLLLRSCCHRKSAKKADR